MQATPGIRPPAVAGLFYPGDARTLARDVDQLLAPHAADPRRPRALLAPHAGYRYSGAVAARAFASTVGHAYDTAVIIGPSHVEAFDFTSVFDGTAFETPLGPVAVDVDVARRIAAGDPSIRLSSRGHAPRGRRGEHAIEVMLPFLQRLAGPIQIVPITMGSQSPAACRALADRITAAIDRERTLLVASSDLSHFHPYAEAVRLDTAFCDILSTLDAGELLDALADGRCEACGGGPVATVLLSGAGANAQARILDRINSGDVTGERESVVGYAAAAIAEGAS